MNKYISNLKNDLPASIVVFLVAVPLCLGIALVSGVPENLFAGIIAGIIGGIVVGIASGSPLGVSGPAAGLAVIVASAIQELGGFEIFLVAVVLAGIFQMILGFINAGIIGYYFPSSVIKGMLAGIGIFIMLKQIPHMLGNDLDPLGDFEFFQVDGHNTFSEMYYSLLDTNIGAAVITAVCLAILILWEQPFMKKIKIFNLIQGPLIAVLAGIGLNVAFQNSELLALGEGHTVALPVAESLGDVFSFFTFPDFSQIFNYKVWVTGATIAVVASLETLLCVEATDKLDPEKRITPTNRELKAQGLGNMLSGLIGGLPITQVIVRSSANIQAGGKTKVSAILHGFLLLICSISIAQFLNLIPMASLAAILLMVGYKLAKPAIFKQQFSMGKDQFIPFIVTIVGIVLTDLLMGIGLGLTIAIFFILFNNYKKPFIVNRKSMNDGEPFIIALAEDVTFINKAGIMNTLNQIPNDSEVVIDMSRSVNIHPDVIEIINDFQENAIERKISVKIVQRNDEKLSNQVHKFNNLLKDNPKEKSI